MGAPCPLRRLDVSTFSRLGVSPAVEPAAPISDKKTAMRCLVVMYHYVHDCGRLPKPGLSRIPPGLPGLSSRQFRAQLDGLCTSLEPVDWPTLYSWMDGRASIPERSFLLTFDDALADHAQTVLPILQERGLRGVFFVPGAVLTARRMLPAHAIHLLLEALDEQTLERELLGYIAEHGGAGTDWAACVDMSTARVLYHYEPPARARLKYLLTITLPVELRDAALDALFRRYIGSPERWAGHWYLGWEDLAEMQSSGHTIGAHGYGHEPYSRLTPAERREDLRQAAEVLRDGLGPDIRPLSYPYGRFDDDTCDACRAAGFVHAFTTESRWVTDGCDRFRLPRVDTIDVELVLEKELAWKNA